MLDSDKIRKDYEQMQHVWGNDRWHMITANRLIKFVKKVGNKYPGIFDGVILNAGSGGNDYGIRTGKMIHLDITPVRIAHLADSLVANVESIPLPDGKIDTIICLGSVLNYSDAIRSISEFKRLLRPDGFLILDFEPSDSLEYFGTPEYKASAAIVQTFFDSRDERIWIYSERYIKSILEFSQFNLISTDRIHYFSPFVYKLSKNQEFSSHFSLLDAPLKHIPYFNRHSCNLILVCKRT